MTNLGMMVMLNQLMGEYGQEIYQKSLGKKITRCEIIANQLIFEFEDDSGIALYDSGQSCCEYRYMHTDDKPEDFIGTIFNGIEIREGPEETVEYGGAKESEFLIVNTSEGQFTVVNYNKHNGYYGGFSLTCIEKSKQDVQEWEFFYSLREKTMTDCNDLTLEDLTDDNIPSEAIICWRCGGWGIISTWFGQYSNLVMTSSDCDMCEGKGWQLPIPTTSQPAPS